MASAVAVAVPALGSSTAPILGHHQNQKWSCGLVPGRSSSARDRDRVGGVRQRKILALVVPPPLVSASDHWGNWTFLLSTAALGIWSEKRTPVGKALSGALVSVLLGLAASSAGVVAADTPAYRVVLEYLLPLAIPLLLFRADLRRVLRSTGALLLAFLLGSRPYLFSACLPAYLLLRL